MKLRYKIIIGIVIIIVLVVVIISINRGELVRCGWSADGEKCFAFSSISICNQTFYDLYGIYVNAETGERWEELPSNENQECLVVFRYNSYTKEEFKDFLLEQWKKKGFSSYNAV